MKKSAEIYPSPKYLLLINFFKSLVKNRLYIIHYTLYIVLLLSLPGQNYYQTLIFAYQKPLVKSLSLSYSSPVPYPALIGSYPKELTSQAIVVIDIPSQTLLYTKNKDLPLTPASTTKIMTAIIALENYPLDKVITVNNLKTEGAAMGLTIGDKLTVENLLYGLLVTSGNDAAFVLADNIPGGYNQFINLMNKKAFALKMKKTHFNNVSGFEDQNHYTTANDLAYLASYALKNPIFLKIVSIPEITVPNYDFTKWYQLKNINKLLTEMPGVFGIKTGYTEEAGECLVASAQRSERKILTIVLNSKDRFSETTYLLDWAFKNFYWQSLN